LVLGRNVARGQVEALNVKIPSELAERFKDVAYWHALKIGEAGEAALLMYVRAKEDEIGGVYAPRPEGVRRPRRLSGKSSKT
jgi:hypothetical protein